MNELELEMRRMLDERSHDARTGGAPAAGVLRRARGRQARTIVGTIGVVVAVAAGSIVGLRAFADRPAGTTLGTTVEPSGSRTSELPYVTISYPADWYLVVFDTPGGRGTIAQLSNFDPELTQPCFRGDGIALPPSGVVLAVERGSGLSGEGVPDHPTSLSYDPAPSACREGGLEETPVPGHPQHYSSSWTSKDGSMPYQANAMIGPEATDAAREAVLDAFGSLSFQTSDASVELPRPAYVIASGVDRGRPWNLEASSGSSGPVITLDMNRVDVGGSITDIRLGDLHGSGVSTAWAQDGTIAWGASSLEVTRILAEGSNGQTTDGEIVTLPPFLDAPFLAFVISMPDPTGTTLSTFDAGGNQIGTTSFGLGARSGGCAPSAEPSSRTQPLPSTEMAQSALRNALAAAKTIYADCGGYGEVSPASMAAVEPSLSYDTLSTASAGTISVRDATESHVLFVTRDSEGNAWCLADDAAVSTTYGVGDAERVEDCAGGWGPTLGSGNDPVGGAWTLHLTHQRLGVGVGLSWEDGGSGSACCVSPLEAGADLRVDQSGTGMGEPDQLIGSASSAVTRVVYLGTDGTEVEGSLFATPAGADGPAQLWLILVPADGTLTGDVVAFDADGHELARTPATSRP